MKIIIEDKRWVGQRSKISGKRMSNMIGCHSRTEVVTLCC